MTIALQTAVIRSPTRLRLLFTVALAAGAFTSLGLCVVSNLDGHGVSPNVLAVLPVPGTPTGLELVLDQGLVDGASYTLTAVGVPGVDSTVTPSGTAQGLSVSSSPTQTDEEMSQLDIGALVYGTDLVHDGRDFVETAAGDLATVSGIPNVQGALMRRLAEQYGLAWDPSYGVQSRGYVDGPSTSALTLKGRIVRQAYADKRVSAVAATFSVDDAGNAYFDTSITLIGAGGVAPIALAVPVPQS